MMIDESTRRSLYDSLAASLGGSQADTLMSLLPQYPLAELATRDDMHSLAIALRGEMALGFGTVDRQFGEVRGEMSELRGELRSEMAEVRGEVAELRGEVRSEMAEVRGEVAELRGEVRSEMAEVRGELGEVRGEMAELRGAIGKLSGDLRAEFSQQVLMLGLLLGTSLLAVLGTLLTLGFTGAFA